MTMISSEMARCKKCGQEQLYTKVLSWNSWMGFPPINNTCWKCGKQLDYDDIDLNTCSPSHRWEVRRDKIYSYLPKEKGRICPECGHEGMHESFLISLNLPEKYEKKNGNKNKYRIYKTSYICPECNFEKYDSEEDIKREGYYKIVEKMNDEENKFIVKEKINSYISSFIRKISRKFYLYIIEKKLIAEGVITTRQEEQKYSDKYYHDLDEKFLGSDINKEDINKNSDDLDSDLDSFTDTEIKIIDKLNKL